MKEDMYVIEPIKYTDVGNFSRATSACYFGQDGSVQTAAINQPRFQAQGYAGLVPLLEVAATNELIWSDDFTASVWAKTGTTILQNIDLAPDDTMTAERLVETNTNGVHGAYQNISKPAQELPFSFSIFVKADQRSTVYLQIDCASGSASCHIDLSSLSTSNLAVSGGFSQVSAKIIDLKNGWRRCSISSYTNTEPSINASCCLTNNGQLSYVGDGVSGCLIWRAQLEMGIEASSPIQSLAAKGFRAADIVSGDPASLSFSNVIENDAPAYSSVKTYAVGEKVLVNHIVYESLRSDNLNKNPVTDATNPPYWLKKSVSNRWLIADGKLSNKLVVASPLTMLFKFGRVNAISLLNISALFVHVSVVRANKVVFSRKIDTRDGANCGDWYEFFFMKFDKKSDIVITDLPVYQDVVISVVLEDPSGQASIGECIIGNAYPLGFTQISPEISMTDYSKIIVDEFGNSDEFERPRAKKMNARVILPNEKTDRVSGRLQAIGSRPCVWVAADGKFSSLVVYGNLKDSRSVLSYSTTKKTILSLEIQGKI